MRSFDDLLDRLAFGWVIRCGEGRPARDKVNRGETLFPPGGWFRRPSGHGSHRPARPAATRTYAPTL